MPIGRRNSSATVTGTTTTLPQVRTDPAVAYGVGQAVALVPNPVTGAPTLMPCGASSYGQHFYGFLAAPAVPGLAPVVIVGRGSLVTPIVENAVLLDPDQPVWLATTPGQVTQGCPTSGWALQVGLAISTTQMVLVTDTRIAQ